MLQPIFTNNSRRFQNLLWQIVLQYYFTLNYKIPFYYHPFMRKSQLYLAPPAIFISKSYSFINRSLTNKQLSPPCLKKGKNSFPIVYSFESKLHFFISIFFFLSQPQYAYGFSRFSLF